MSDNGWPPELPPPGQAPPATLRKWIDDGLYYTHRIRVSDASAHRRAELYDACYQWLKRAQAGYDTIGSSQWVQDYWDPADPNFIDTPTFNEGLPARMNESARLGRPNYRPTARTKGENPLIQERQGAKKLQDMLRHRLEEMGWNVEKELAYYHMPVYRGVWLKSEWENRYDDLTTAPVKGAVKCAGKDCGFTLASKKVPFALASKVPALAENAAAQVGADSMDVQACPTCPDHPPMLPFKPSMEEAVTGQDSVGRPLGEQLPKGNWWLSIRNADDMFPRNLGLDMRPGHIDEWSEAHVEHLDWAALRYPQKAGLLKPESAASLAKFHPIAGAPDVYQSVIDVKTFESSLRIKERHKKPWMERTVGPDGSATFKLNRGRSVVMGGDVVLLDAPFLLDNINRPEADPVERVFVDYIPWEIREGGRRLEGLGLWDMIFDAQDVANTIWSQAGAVRERLALPIYAVARTFNFDLQALKGGVPGRMAEFDIDPNAPALRPEMINNQTIAEGAWRELDSVTTAIHDRYTGNARVEGGAPPPGVDAAQAIRELKEASGEKREPRIRRIRTGFKRAYGHGARLMQALYIEPRPCKYEDEDGEERWKSLTGLELGTDVEVDVEPEEVDADEKRMQVKDLIGTGAINLADPNTPPALRRRVARYLGAPEDLYEDEDLQEKSAQREWIRFKDENKIPVVDPSLDEHLEHYQDHGRRAHSEWFRDKEDAANWDAALNILAPTWEATLQAVAQAAMAPALPPGAIDPVTKEPVPPRVSVQMMLMKAWSGQLDAAQFQPGPVIPPGAPVPDTTDAEDALAVVLAWRAHMESHKLEAQLKQMRAQVQPELGAPGGEATAAGNQPTAAAGPAAAPPMPGPAVNAQNQPAGVH